MPAYEYMPLSGWCLLHQTVYNNKMAFIDFNPPVQVMNILFVWWFYSISIILFHQFFSTHCIFDSLDWHHNFIFIHQKFLYFSQDLEMKCMMVMQMKASNTYMLCHVTIFCICSVYLLLKNNQKKENKIKKCLLTAWREIWTVERLIHRKNTNP